MDEIQLALTFNWATVILGIILAAFVIVILVELFKKVCEIFGIEFKSKREHLEDHNLLQMLSNDMKELKNLRQESVTGDEAIKEDMSKIINHLNKLEKRSEANEFAIRECLADKINSRYKKYIKLNGIPEDEYAEFVLMFNSYKGVGGNSTAEAKFDYCIKNLAILPSTVSLDGYMLNHN